MQNSAPLKSSGQADLARRADNGRVRNSVSGIEHIKPRSVCYKHSPSTEWGPMRENRERWMQLCEQAANEQDPEKLMELVAEITRLLEAKERRLKGDSSTTESTS